MFPTKENYCSYYILSKCDNQFINSLQTVGSQLLTVVAAVVYLTIHVSQLEFGSHIDIGIAYTSRILALEQSLHLIGNINIHLVHYLIIFYDIYSNCRVNEAKHRKVHIDLIFNFYYILYPVFTA